jgi:miniconductance mechanosensitive channel
MSTIKEELLPLMDILSRPAIAPVVQVLVLLFFCVLVYFLFRKIVSPIVSRLLKRTRIKIDDYLVDYHVIDRLMLLVPGLIFNAGLPLLPDYLSFLSRLVLVYIAISVIAIVFSVINALVAISVTRPILSKWPIKGWAQLVKIFLSVIAAVFIFAVLIDRSPWGLVSGIGALTAVILLIFKDTLLSFVASLQIASYDLIRLNDWIEMPAFSANGTVMDMSLHSVRVQNFDNTFVSIPTHKFLDYSFKNWRGMFETGSRRIMRSVLIDQSSVRFMDDDLLAKCREIDLLSDYLAKKDEEIREYHEAYPVGGESPLNRRRLTNLGTFRAYVLAYLERHPNVITGQALMVRHLQPEADKGIPLEVYCFVDDTRWPHYEKIQADIFDHMLAALPEFGLRAYQRTALVDGRSAA